MEEYYIVSVIQASQGLSHDMEIWCLKLTTGNEKLFFHVVSDGFQKFNGLWM